MVRGAVILQCLPRRRATAAACSLGTRSGSGTFRRGNARMAERGFTLVEVFIVLIIVGIVLAIAVPAVDSYVQRSRIGQCVVDLTEMSGTIRKREKDTGALPDSLDDVGFASRVDPWGNSYEYFNLRALKGNGQARKDKNLKPLNSDFDLYSIGRDRQTNASLTNAKSRDDVVRARDGRFIGTAEEFDP
jgi:general secretion pathway protein G